MLRTGVYEGHPVEPVIRGTVEGTTVRKTFVLRRRLRKRARDLRVTYVIPYKFSCEVELGKYVEAYEPLNSSFKTACVREGGVEIGRRAKLFIRSIYVWAEEHYMLDCMIWVFTWTIWHNVWDPLPG
jgi:hypothetical protein